MKFRDFTFDDYGEQAHATAQYPEPEKFHYVVYGLAEVGEVTGKLKHLWRDKGTDKWADVSRGDRLSLLKELGDALWYINEAAIALDSSLGEVAALNNNKLAGRAERGTILGEGDDR